MKRKSSEALPLLWCLTPKSSLCLVVSSEWPEQSHSTQQSSRKEAWASLRRPGLLTPSGLHGRQEGQEGDAPLTTLSCTRIRM